MHHPPQVTVEHAPDSPETLTARNGSLETWEHLRGPVSGTRARQPYQNMMRAQHIHVALYPMAFPNPYSFSYQPASLQRPRLALSCLRKRVQREDDVPCSTATPVRSPSRSSTAMQHGNPPSRELSSLARSTAITDTRNRGQSKRTNAARETVTCELSRPARGRAWFPAGLGRCVAANRRS